ncbi:hypothetical protein SH467x_000887 [Pirellulaceae bacterium SH467]
MTFQQLTNVLYKIFSPSNNDEYRLITTIPAIVNRVSFVTRNDLNVSEDVRAIVSDIY